MKTFLLIMGAISTILLVAILLAFPVKWLWNWLMPELFNLSKITVWQALGLNVLTGFFFRSYSTTKN